ncbi:MAG: TIGR04190 family B12-binding domain/radical SAM domain protein [Clostridia bacterium]|nr:TIGR04190 family B12-binding domain/radical SAM domain protein [Clostridia bacterium]
MLRRIFRKDLIFLHAPSVYDFRKDTIMFGPISDVVPSSSAFEMYPIGITSIAATLERNGFNVQIINLAYQMLRDPGYDVEKVIAKLNPMMFALDLHWLPHAHGSCEVAKIVKKYHPNTPILFGGLSASYFHEELVSYPFVDFVVRGDSTEEPIRQLVTAVKYDLPLHEVPNLTWKEPNGTVMVNQLSFVPENIDYTDIPSYKYVVGSVFKYYNLHNAVPYLEWLSYPTTVLLTARGCAYNCSICGGSKYAYKKICNRDKPAYRSPKTLIEDIRLIQTFGEAPIFILHDLRMAGMDYAREFFSLVKKETIKNELIIELFTHADEEYFKLINDSVPKYSLEMTLESHDEAIRKLNGKFPCTNAEVEATIAAALDHGCRKIDIFFMTGIPKQTYENAVSSIDYCRHLLEKFNGDQRLALFIAPLAPFLDPGSLAYENPETYGYKKFCHTLEDHRRALMQPSWKQILSFETTSMTRDQIVDSTYEAAYRLNELKREYQLIDQEVYEKVKYRIEAARQVIKEIDNILLISDEISRKQALDALKTKVEDLNRHTICGKDELKWPLRKRFSGGLSLFKLLAALLLNECNQVWGRFTGRYEPAQPLSNPITSRPENTPVE